MRSYNYRTCAAERHASDGRFSAKRFTSADRIDFNLDGTTLGRMDIKSSELNIRLLLQSDGPGIIFRIFDINIFQIYRGRPEKTRKVKPLISSGFCSKTRRSLDVHHKFPCVDSSGSHLFPICSHAAGALSRIAHIVLGRI